MRRLENAPNSAPQGSLRLLGVLAALALVNPGCASICTGPFDAQYLATGGLWERVDPYGGSVASLASPEASLQQRRLSTAEVPRTILAPDRRRESAPLRPREWSPGDPMLDDDLPPAPPDTDQPPGEPMPDPDRERIETWAPRGSQLR